MRHNLRGCRYIKDFLCRPKFVNIPWKNGGLHLTASLHHCTEPSHGTSLPLERYKNAFPRLTKLTNLLKNLDLFDGRLLNVDDNSTVDDVRLLHRMHHFKALARVFLGHPCVQEELMKNVKAAMSGRKCNPPFCFARPIEREPMIVDTLTKVCNFLKISTQQRKTIRFTICPQVTQHRIWTGALEEILKGLKRDLELLDNQSPSKGTFMGKQIVSTCLEFLAKTASRLDEDASSWMRPKPLKSADSLSSHKWEEVLEMSNDLIKYLRNEEGLSFHVSKLEVMKEGLTKIKDVVIDRDIGYKEVQHHETLVQKKLVQTLGHSSRCLFTLLRYYLHGTIQDMEVEVGGGFCDIGDKDTFCLYMGKIMTSFEEKMIWSGIKQLDRALGLFKFIWETAGMKGMLELQGHLWCVGTESRTIAYRGNLFIIHGISL